MGQLEALAKKVLSAERLRSKKVTSLKVPEVVRAELFLGCLKSARPD
jgi:hypothetical protein